MRLYRYGDEGPAVRDIQDRLAALGYESPSDTRSKFGDDTLSAVVSFQKAKGLAPDGIVGPDTWRSLYEAGYRFGDRLLLLRRPMMRGEDVSELQSRLNSLGFDSGKVDGVFGSETERAVLDFQHNRGLAEDGKVGPSVITEMFLVTRGEMKEGRDAIREREWLRGLAPTMAGARIYLDAGCRTELETRTAWEAATGAALKLQEGGSSPVLSRSHGVKLPERVRARRANRFGVDLIVAFQLNEAGEDRVFYFASELSRSEAGSMLAEAVAKHTGAKVEGRANALLKETRAPAIIVSCGSLSVETGEAVTAGVADFFAENASR